MIGEYVKYKENIYIICREAGDMILILNPLDESPMGKLNVKNTSVEVLPFDRAKVIAYRGREYLVTLKGAVISLIICRLMRWDEGNGDRKAILSLAGL